MTSRKVLHVIPGLGTGGAEHMLATLVTAKRDVPIEQAVVNLMAGGELAAGIRTAGVAVHELGMTGAATFPGTVLRLAAIIREIKPDAIQSWLYYGDLIALLALGLSGRRSQTRLYWGIRCSDMDQSQYRAALRYTIAACARLSARPDAVVANSFAGRDVHTRLGYAPRAFPVIPNGIDTRRFRPDPDARRRIRNELGIADDKPLVAHVARIDPMKDHDSLLAAAAALPQIEFVAVGTGTESLRAPPNVKCLGRRGDVAAIYAASDVALSTSAFGEGFPNVIAEAMASGVPVVATDVGDTRRIVGDTGVSLPPRAVPQIVAAIQHLSDETGVPREQRRARCRSRIVEHFSLEKAVAAFDALHLHGTLPDPAIASR